MEEDGMDGDMLEVARLKNKLRSEYRFKKQFYQEYPYAGASPDIPVRLKPCNKITNKQMLHIAAHAFGMEDVKIFKRNESFVRVLGSYNTIEYTECLGEDISLMVELSFSFYDGSFKKTGGFVTGQEFIKAYQLLIHWRFLGGFYDVSHEDNVVFLRPHEIIQLGWAEYSN